MKQTTKMHPEAAFPDAKEAPDDAQLADVLGKAGSRLAKVTSRLRTDQPSVTIEWKYSDRSGWYQIYVLKKRRLLYLVPRRGDYMLSLILGGKAIAQLQQGPVAAQTAELLKTAKKYPEGTAFSFERKTLDPDILAHFLTAKIAF